MSETSRTGKALRPHPAQPLRPHPAPVGKRAVAPIRPTIPLPGLSVEGKTRSGAASTSSTDIQVLGRYDWQFKWVEVIHQNAWALVRLEDIANRPKDVIATLAAAGISILD